MANNNINWNKNGEELSQSILQFIEQIENMGKNLAAQAGTAIAASTQGATSKNDWRLPFGLSTRANLTPSETLERAVKKRSTSTSETAIVGLVFLLTFGIGAFTLAFLLQTIPHLPSIIYLPTVICSSVAVGSGLLLRSAMKNVKEVRKIRTYLSIIGPRSSCTLAELAAGTLSDEREVLATLLKGIEADYLPGLYISSDQRQLFIGRKAYAQTLASEPEPQQSSAPAPAAKGAGGSGNAEVDALLVQGREFAAELAKLASQIDDPEILSKLGEICNISERIFVQVGNSPEKANQIRKFMTYYLPTTIKLVTTYTQVQARGIEGENATQIKANIKGVLGTMCTSFSALLDSLFEDEALDVSTDITVLKSLLAEEGLMNEDFQLR
ncbi:5-bromo-4-chloroindolyl phosphate hydrolysis family protein [Ruminococcaceae bacterium OttesenSCG-928-N02]|nr:5-bromo-4-chloroindolyl phosphate hydrolysis family protein [Ruminococcaceae bacterium OttesenSCG-928-N02]